MRAHLRVVVDGRCLRADNVETQFEVAYWGGADPPEVGAAFLGENCAIGG